MPAGPLAAKHGQRLLPHPGVDADGLPERTASESALLALEVAQHHRQLHEGRGGLFGVSQQLAVDAIDLAGFEVGPVEVPPLVVDPHDQPGLAEREDVPAQPLPLGGVDEQRGRRIEQPQRRLVARRLGRRFRANRRICGDEHAHHRQQSTLHETPIAEGSQTGEHEACRHRAAHSCSYNTSHHMPRDLALNPSPRRGTTRAGLAA